MKTYLRFNSLFAICLFIGIAALSSCEKEEPPASSSSSTTGDPPEEDVVFSGSQTWSYDIEGDTLMLSFGYEGTRNTNIRGNLVLSVTPGTGPNHIRQVSFVLDGECIRIFSDGLGMSGSYTMEDIVLEEGSHYFLTEVYTTNNDEMRNIRREGTNPVWFDIGTHRILCRNISISYTGGAIVHHNTDGLTMDSISIGIAINGNTCNNIDIRCRIHHAIIDSTETLGDIEVSLDGNYLVTYSTGTTPNFMDVSLFNGSLERGRHVITRKWIQDGVEMHTTTMRFYI